MSYSFFKSLKWFRIILGSQSPRRKQLLTDAGLDFDVQVRPVDETFPENLTGEEAAVFLAEQKWNSFADECSAKNNLVITADTMVCLGKELIGKPADEAEAIYMLNKLSGKSHHVVTGVKIGNSFYSEKFFVTTEVKFRKLSEEEIVFYVKEYKPFDKAGAYGAQDWIGLTAIERMEGSFYNVMGLPVMEVYGSLKNCVNELSQ